jgi:hypothetical protein
MDTELEAIKQKERFKGLEQQIQDMLLSVDYKKLVKELDSRCKYLSSENLEIVRILYKIKESGLYDNDNDKKKLQKVLSHYAVERAGMIILKP